MADTSRRALRLLSLLQTRRYWPGGELAGQLRVSPRTLRRDIDRLREFGYPIQAQRGVAGGYQLAAGTALPPLVVDDEEAVAPAVGLQAAAQRAVEGIALACRDAERIRFSYTAADGQRTGRHVEPHRLDWPIMALGIIGAAAATRPGRPFSRVRAAP
jgi:predicted DNA-binding transcriptional regulator YafY